MKFPQSPKKTVISGKKSVAHKLKSLASWDFDLEKYAMVLAGYLLLTAGVLGSALQYDQGDVGARDLHAHRVLAIDCVWKDEQDRTRGSCRRG